MSRYARRLVFTDGRVEDSIQPHQDRERITLPAFVKGKFTSITFLFDQELSDRDGMSTYVQEDSKEEADKDD